DRAGPIPALEKARSCRPPCLLFFAADTEVCIYALGRCCMSALLYGRHRGLLLRLGEMLHVCSSLWQTQRSASTPWEDSGSDEWSGPGRNRRPIRRPLGDYMAVCKSVCTKSLPTNKSGSSRSLASA